MEQIICIYCGHKADIVQQDDLSTADCSQCNRKTELNEYKKMVGLWLKSLAEEN